MSTFPTAFDATFPGYPYVDNTQFVDQTQANAWVQAIQAIESTIGYGTLGTPASPLYSAAYATTYATVTARIAALETVVVGGLKLNTVAANIQPVGVAALAGGSGLAADATHVHPGQAPASLKQIGEIFMWPASPATYPAGAGTVFQCNGQGISTSTYATLFGIIGYTYGGVGATFNLPNYNDKFPIGVGTIASAAGSTGGSTSISVNNLPSHSHNPITVTINDAGHTTPTYLDETGPGANEAVYFSAGSTLNINPATSSPPLSQPVSFSPSGGGQLHWARAFTGITATASGVGVGAGTAYTQPFIGMYFLIRAL